MAAIPAVVTAVPAVLRTDPTFARVQMPFAAPMALLSPPMPMTAPATLNSPLSMSPSWKYRTALTAFTAIPIGMS